MENKMLELLKTRRSVRAYKPEQIQAQELDAVLEAGTYAPTGMGMQSPVIVAVQSPSYRRAVMELNQKARGMEGDPYYGAPPLCWCWRTRPGAPVWRTPPVCYAP